MTSRVFTARISYAGADRVNVTRKSAGADGLAFAPSWRIVTPMVKLRREKGPAAVEYVWPFYAAVYRAEMRLSYREHRREWNALLARSEVTLVCYCIDPAFCHRTLLAEILGKLGATYCGERPALEAGCSP